MATAQIEIASSPANVRHVLLDFSAIPQWHTGFIQSISLATPKKSTLEKGDKLNCTIGGFSFSPLVLENTDTVFQWQAAPVYGLIGGIRTFRFEPSKITPGSTTFIQSEECSGILSFMMNPSLPGGKRHRAQFEVLNKDLKARVESLYPQR